MNLLLNMARNLSQKLWKKNHRQKTKEAVEGAGTFKLIGQDKYILMYDVYMKGSYQFTETTDWCADRR